MSLAYCCQSNRVEIMAQESDEEYVTCIKDSDQQNETTGRRNYAVLCTNTLPLQQVNIIPPPPQR